MKTRNPISRRGFMAASSLQLLMARISRKAYATAGEKRLRLWATGCPHVGNDIRRGRGRTPRESLADAIRQSESADGFHWDVALCLGDFSGHQGIPPADEGREVVRQFGALRKHGREQFYCLGGNHDASPQNAWFQHWIDPMGENPAASKVHPGRRPYPVQGDWQRYCFRIGNLLFAMMSDRNDYAPPVGRIADGKGHGGRPPGAVTLETFNWWRDLVEQNPDAIIVSAHHHMLKETTATSGPWEGFRRDDETDQWQSHTHGYFPDDGIHNRGAGYLYWLVDESQSPIDARPDAQVFEKYLAANPGAMDLWIGGHSHMVPDAVVSGRTHMERKWDVNFLNCCALTKYHGGRAPMSRLLTFVDGSDKVQVECYLHTSDFAPKGWYHPASGTLRLSKPFEI
ncbi:MAG: metallophosphoesterase [Pirellulaceae bacterium]